jgi:hypothetical protein
MIIDMTVQCCGNCIYYRRTDSLCGWCASPIPKWVEDAKISAEVLPNHGGICMMFKRCKK